MAPQEIKTLHIPFLPELDRLTGSDAITNMVVDRGVRCPIDTLNWPGQFPYAPLSICSVAHTEKAIYLDFFVRCNYLRAVNTANNSSVHQDSCVEFFVQPRLDDPHYYNFEFNCIGTIHAAKRLDRHTGEKLTDAELDTVQRYPSCGTRPFQEIQGLFTWNLLVVIPLSTMGVEWKGEPIEMRGNFYKCADLASVPHFLSWNPITTEQPDFHRPEYFGKIILE